MKTEKAMTVWNEPLMTSAGIPDAESYQHPVRAIPGYNGRRGTKHSCLSGLANVSIVRAAFPDWTREHHARRAVQLRALAVDAENAWDKRWESAYLAIYGRVPALGDYRISGIGDDRIAETDKDELRRLAVLKGQLSGLAH